MIKERKIAFKIESSWWYRLPWRDTLSTPLKYLWEDRNFHSLNWSSLILFLGVPSQTNHVTLFYYDVSFLSWLNTSLKQSCDYVNCVTSWTERRRNSTMWGEILIPTWEARVTEFIARWRAPTFACPQKFTQQELLNLGIHFQPWQLELFKQISTWSGLNPYKYK